MTDLLSKVSALLRLRGERGVGRRAVVKGDRGTHGLQVPGRQSVVALAGEEV